jgi:hypothetical protein
MDQKQIARQMVEFNKTVFDNSFTAMTALQDQTETFMLNFFDNAAWFPAEGKKAVHDWITSYKKGREDFKTTADERYQKVTEYFARTEK